MDKTVHIARYTMQRFGTNVMIIIIEDELYVLGMSILVHLEASWINCEMSFGNIIVQSHLIGCSTYHEFTRPHMISQITLIPMQKHRILLRETNEMEQNARECCKIDKCTLTQISDND